MELKLPIKETTEFIFWSNISNIIFEQLFRFHCVSDFSSLLILCSRNHQLDKQQFNRTFFFFLEIMSAAEPEMITGSVAATSTSQSASAVFLSLLIPALVLYYIYFKMSRRHMIELAEKIPGPEGLPVIGNMLLLLGSSDSKAINIKTL